MSGSLFDAYGHRKYLVSSERSAFVSRALTEDDMSSSFFITLAITGARISEVLAVTPERVDTGNEAIVFETLKRRQTGVFRAVPVPTWLLAIIRKINRAPGDRVWPWGRTTGWKIVKRVMLDAGIPEHLCTPKALRHAFAVEAGQNGVPLNVVQRWLGHARIETTAIYSGALGQEERNLAHRVWANLESDVLSYAGGKYSDDLRTPDTDRFRKPEKYCGGRSCR